VLPARSLSHQADSGLSATTTEDVTQQVVLLALKLSLDIAICLTPLIQTNIAEGYATITPINNPTSNIQQLLMEHGLELVKVKNVTVGPA